MLFLLAFVGFFLYTRPNGAPEVGECIAEQERYTSTSSRDVMPETLDCSDPEAKYKVVSVRAVLTEPGAIPPENDEPDRPK
ncbi:hypothetical protein ACFORJ_04255 [Corynebacterium hansenii]|uniref:Secreted protein n=1 Tax=Corynebacterium hansenii TaxID=394964 RepID=A0ABV7ZLF5_9CORY|nr:hypothetical protein [Corynebacterium hansenii]WJY98790.1 hypothetical protein CHAN_00750 [Corynebacterium hansenii]